MTTILNKLTHLSNSSETNEDIKEDDEDTSIHSFKKLQDLAEKEKKLPSKATRAVHQTGRKFLSSAAASPKTLSDFLRYGSEYLAGKGEEQQAMTGTVPTEEQLRFTQNVVKGLGLPSKLLEKYAPNYTPENIEKKIIELQKKTGVNPAPLDPTSKLEENLGKISSAAGSAAPFGLGAVGATALMEGGMLGAEKAGLGKTGQTITGMSLPVFLDVIRAIRNRRYIPRQGEATELYNAGRAFGMTDEELAPLLASETQVGMGGKIAGGLRRTEEAFEHSNAALNRVREEIFERGQQLGLIPTNVARDLAQDFTNARNRLSQTLNPSPKEQLLIDFIEEGITRLNSGEATVNELMGFRRSLNSIEGGQNALGQLRPRMDRALQRVDRNLNRDFNDYNRLYEFYSQNLQRITPDMFRNIFGAAEAGKILENVLTGNPGKAAIRTFTAPFFSRLASSVITDPVMQSIHRNIARAVRDNNANLALGAYNQLKKHVKNKYPEESEKIEWPPFD